MHANSQCFGYKLTEIMMENALVPGFLGTVATDHTYARFTTVKLNQRRLS